MLIRRSHNHCLLQFVRHQVKNLFNNLFASLYFLAIGHILKADRISNSPTTKAKTLYPTHTTHTTLSTHAFLDTSVNSSLLYPALQWLWCDWPVTRLAWSNAITKIGQSRYVITNTTTNCNPHDLRKSGGKGAVFMPSLCQVSVLGTGWGQVRGKGRAMW